MVETTKRRCSVCEGENAFCSACCGSGVVLGETDEPVVPAGHEDQETDTPEAVASSGASDGDDQPVTETANATYSVPVVCTCDCGFVTANESSRVVISALHSAVFRYPCSGCGKKTTASPRLDWAPPAVSGGPNRNQRRARAAASRNGKKIIV